MNSRITAVLARIFIALIGYAVLFTVYLGLLATASGKVLHLAVLWHITATTFLLPIIDARQNFQMLARLHWFIPKPGREEIVRTVIHDLRVSLITEGFLFIVLILAIVLFERSRHKNARSIALFYAVVPTLLWILWSQLYLFV